MYDLTISNNTDDEVKKFSFKLTFSHEAYLASAWNGALEIHQFRDGTEKVDTIPDLRSFNHEDYNLDMFYCSSTNPDDGMWLVTMYEGDYLIYIPSDSKNALEMPIKPHEGTVPGIIMYVEKDQTIEDSSLVIDYTLYRYFTNEPFSWVAIIGF